MLGLPPISGMVPHSFLHTRSLIRKGESCKANSHNNSNKMLSSVDVEVVSSADTVGGTDVYHIVYEQRISNLLQSLMIGVMCFAPFIAYLRYIPRCTLNGLFVILGVSGLDGNQFYHRLVYLLCDTARRDDYAVEHCPLVDSEVENVVKTTDIKYQTKGKGSSYLDKIPFHIVCLFTLLQLCACLIIFGITFTPAVIIFPVLIGVLVPFRLYILPLSFDTYDLNILDPLNS